MDREARQRSRERFLAEIEQQVRDVESATLDIDATVDESLDVTGLPDSPVTLGDLDRAINLEEARPRDVEFQRLDAGSYSITLPGGGAIRVTTDTDVFEFSGDSHQLFSACGEVFRAFCSESTELSGEHGIAWTVRREGESSEFLIATRYGLQRIQAFFDLLTALGATAMPGSFPLAEWPGMSVSTVA